MYSTISRETLTVFMTRFYEKALQDEVLAPFFIHELGDNMEDEDWVEHIDLLADFWLAELVGEDTYIGNFIGAHIKVPHINKESFISWLTLFSQTAKEVYEPNIAQKFILRGDELAKEFMSALSIEY